MLLKKTTHMTIITYLTHLTHLTHLTYQMLHNQCNKMYLHLQKLLLFLEKRKSVTVCCFAGILKRSKRKKNWKIKNLFFSKQKNVPIFFAIGDVVFITDFCLSLCIVK